MGNVKRKSKIAEENAIPKTITIFPKHQRFIESRSINLSRFIQRKLDEEIEAQGWTEKR